MAAVIFKTLSGIIDLIYLPVDKEFYSGEVAVTPTNRLRHGQCTKLQPAQQKTARQFETTSFCTCARHGHLTDMKVIEGLDGHVETVDVPVPNTARRHSDTGMKLRAGAPPET
jgi:hypothetical protein